MPPNRPDFLIFGSPLILEEDIREVVDTLKSGWIGSGPKVKFFEEGLKKFLGSDHVVAVNSCTSALSLALEIIGLKPGDEVVTTPITFPATANVIVHRGATPVFVDVDPRTGNIDPDLVAQAAKEITAGGRQAEKWLPRKGVTPGGKLRALLPVDVFGQPADMDKVNATALKLHLPVIEDSCEALGATYKGQPAGMLGDYGIFAFYPNKQITTGEGGVIITSDDKAADLMRALRNQGRAPGDTWLSHTHLGYNYRLDEMSAALGVVQMSRLDELLKKREQVAEWYGDRLSEIPGVEVPIVENYTTRMSWFVYVIKVDKKIDRDRLAKRLESRGVPVRPYFLPIHLQPYMVERFDWREGDFPVTEDLGRRGLAIPFSGVMTEEQVETVCRVIREEI